VAASCEHGNEPSVSIKEGAFIDKLSDLQILNRTLLHGVSLITNFLSEFRLDSY
jgi:hypothetical protein